ncbi:MAG TPA: hypothetical protein VN812_21695 [Candidatus Acidoferrales bacterium]|nr:hypothetical protein [Candidatus Acidoferrales bacterium]
MGKYEDLIAGEDGLPALTGRAWVFGDRVSRQQLLADAHLRDDAVAAAAHVFAAVDPDFARTVQPGDFIVAGLDFAADVTQRIVPAALKRLGVAAVIARSFGPFFLRHAVNAGLAAVVVEETGAIRPGDRLRVDVEAHIVANLSSGDRYVIRNLDDDAIAMLRESVAAWER